MSGEQGAVEAWFQEGMVAARSGQRARARELLRRVVQADEGHYQAWLWLAGVAEGEEQRACVARLLALGGNPAALSAVVAGPAEAGEGQVPTGRPVRRVSRRDLLQARLEPVWPAVAALGLLAAITSAELATTLIDARLGMVLHVVILILLLVQVALAEHGGLQALFLCLALAPLIRVLSLSLPLRQFPIVYWYLITSVPLFAAVLVAVRSLGYSWQALGLTLRGWPLQLAVGLSGLLIGAAEYTILRPEPLVPELSLAAVWQPALILLACTGLLEEVVFRGLLQRAAGEALGRWGMPYVALLFAVLHLGYQSLLDIGLVFLVGLFFGEVVQRTRSLLGVTLAHGLTNIMLFLIMPFVLP